MERRKYRINLASQNSVEIELQADSFQSAGENAVEFILGNHIVLCLCFRSRIEKTVETTTAQDISRPDYMERRIDLDL